MSTLIRIILYLYKHLIKSTMTEYGKLKIQATYLNFFKKNSLYDSYVY